MTLLAATIAGLLTVNVLMLGPHGPIDVAEAIAPAAIGASAGLRTPSASCEPLPVAARAALVLVVGLPGVTDPEHEFVEELIELGVGGVLITKTNVRSAEQIRGLIGDLRARSVRRLLVATDEEPGRVSSFGTLIGRSSSARTLARRFDAEQMRDFAYRLGLQLADFGIDLDLAPVVDLDGGPAGGIIGDRSFSMSPETTTAQSLAFSQGLAGAGVLATAKHFPGHGRSGVDSHRTLATVDTTLADLRARDLRPFAAQIRAGVPVVMLGHIAFSALDPALPASLSPGAYELLRSLGFEGVAMTDSLGMGAVHQHWDFPQSAVMAVAAGADAVLVTDGRQATRMRDALVAAVNDGTLPEHRLTEASARMFALLGLDPLEIVCFDVLTPQGPLSVAERPSARLGAD